MEDLKSSHGEASERASPNRIQYSLEEAKTVLAGHSLSSMQFGDYLVILKSEFDMIIAAEPYHALSFLLDMKSGVFLARIWNKTVQRGKAGSAEELDEACTHHFRERRLCLGLFEDEGEQAGLRFLTSQTPIPRKISKTCLGFLCEDACLDEHACRECLKLGSQSQKAPIKLETVEDPKSETTKDPKLEDASDDYENESLDVNSHLQTVVEEMEKEFLPQEESKLFECEQCDYATPKRFLLKRHLKSHSEERPFECSDCNSCFKRPEDLLQHTNTHLGSKPYQCKYCDAGFNSSGERVRHIRHVHTKDKQHK